MRISLRSTPSGVDLVEGDLEGRLQALLTARELAAREAGERSAMASVAALVDQAVERIDAGGEQALEALKQDAIELAIEIAQHVLRREIAKEDYDIEALVRETLAAAQTGRAACTVYLHPEEAARLSGVKFRTGTQICPDETISKGSVHVQSRAGFLVRDIDECLRNVGDRLREALA